MSSAALEPVTVEVPYLTLLKSMIRENGIGRLMLKFPKQGDREGKSLMAPPELFKKFRPFLMTVRVVSPDGNPIPGAELDWWQADTVGNYYHRTYTLRGRVTTDENGYAEVLTVAPYPYGIGSAKRAAHFHVWIHAPSAQPGQTAYDDLTTQMYVCDANDYQIMRSDFVNYMRKSRLGNMVRCWSIPDKDVDEGRLFKGFPELPSSDKRTVERVEWWNSKLSQLATRSAEPGWKIAAGGTTELHLNPKGGQY